MRREHTYTSGSCKELNCALGVDNRKWVNRGPSNIRCIDTLEGWHIQVSVVGKGWVDVDVGDAANVIRQVSFRRNLIT